MSINCLTQSGYSTCNDAGWFTMRIKYFKNTPAVKEF